MCLKRVCPTWTIDQFRILAEIRPFEFELLLNKDFFKFSGLILNNFFELLNRQKSSATLFLVLEIEGRFISTLTDMNTIFFAQSSRLHMYEQTGAKIAEIGPANVEINRP